MLKIINFDRKKEILHRVSFFYLPIFISFLFCLSISWSVQSPLHTPANHEIVSYFSWMLFAIFIFLISKNNISINIYAIASIFLLLLINETNKRYYIADDRLLLLIYTSNIFLYHSIISSSIKNNYYLKEIITKTIFLSFFTAAITISIFIFYQWTTYGNSISEVNNWILPSNSNRFSGNLGQPNHASTILCLGVAAAYFFFEKKKNSIFLIAIPFLVFSIFLTGSRTGILVIFSICFIHLIKSKLNIRNIIIFTLPFIITVLLHLIQYSLPSDNQHTPKGIESGRYLIYKIAIDLIKERPIFGYGFNNITPKFIEVISNYKDYTEKSSLSSFHNIILDISFQFGLIIGIAAFAIFLVFLLKLIKSKNDQIKYIASSIIVIAIHAFLEFPLNYVYFIFPLLTLLSISSNSLRTINLDGKIKSTVFFAFFILTISTTLVFIKSFNSAEIDYKKIRLQYLGVSVKTPFKENFECFTESMCDYLNSHLYAISKTPINSNINFEELFKKYPTPYTLNLAKTKTETSSILLENNEEIACLIFKNKYCK